MPTGTPVALRAASFLDTIGVNAHINWQVAGSAYADYNKIKSSIEYLGIKYVRDAVPVDWSLPMYQTLANQGVKFNLLVTAPEFNSTGSFKTDLERIAALVKTNPGSVASIEGLNEINTWTVNYKGQNTGSNLAIGHDIQALLYREADGFASLKDLPVLNLTTGGLSGQQASVMGDMSAIADYGNWHVYFGKGDQPGTTIAKGVAAAKQLAPADPVQITESNYYTAVETMEWGGGGVTEAVQAKFVLNLLMDAAKAGVARTYLYELLDNSLNAPTTVEGSLGLFHSDGTPKPAATAVRNLNAILADTSATARSFDTTRLDVSVSGLPSTGNTLLLEKAGGVYNLVLWAEPDIWDQSAHKEIAAPASTATVTLGQSYGTIKIYDPLTGTAPIATARNTNKITTKVTDHPLIVEIAGPIAATPTTVTKTIGSGTDSIVLRISQDAYQGDAQYTVSLDGKQVGGTLTAKALRGTGQTDLITVKGELGLGDHSVRVNFLNDAWGGTAATDRNLYVESATINGAAVPGSTITLEQAGPASLTVKDLTSPLQTIGSGTDQIALKISQDYYKGDAQYVVLVDGTQIGGTLTARGQHGLGQHDPVIIKGSWGPGEHTVTVTFLNDAWDGTPQTDRNLYVERVDYDGRMVSATTTALMDAGSARFTVYDMTAPSVSWLA